MKHLICAPFFLLWKYRVLLWQTTRNDIRVRFSGSVLGLSWLVLYPLLLLSVYASVYVFIFKVRFQLFNSNEYVALIFCGLIPFLGFSEALGLGVTSVTSNSSLIKNTLFPIDLIPTKAVFVSQCTQVVGMGLLIITLIFLGKITPLAPLFIIVWISQILFSVGLIWILSSLNVYLKDLQNVVSVVILFLMMVSPIAYTADMVPAGIRPLLGLNPLFYFIIAYQDILMLGQFPRGSIFWVVLGLGLVGFPLGYWFFERMKMAFVDSV